MGQSDRYPSSNARQNPGSAYPGASSDEPSYLHSGVQGSRNAGYQRRRVSQEGRHPVGDRNTAPVPRTAYPSGYRSIHPSVVNERLPFTHHNKPDPNRVKYICRSRLARLHLLPLLQSARYVVFDTETADRETGAPTTATNQAVVVLSSFLLLKEGWEEAELYVLRGNDTILELAPWLSSPNHYKIGHNMGFDRNVVKDALSIDFQGWYADTMLMYWSLDTERGEGKETQDLALKNIAMKEYGLPYPDFDTVWGLHKEKNKNIWPSMWDVIDNPHCPFYNKEKALYYSACDVWEAAWVYKDCRAMLMHEGMWDMVRRVEFPFLLELEKMEEWGMAEDLTVLEGIREQCEDRVARLRHRWRHQVRSPFANPSSSASQQRRHIFFTHGEYISASGDFKKPGPHRWMSCGCAKPHKADEDDITHFTDTGNIATDKEAINRLVKEGCQAALLLKKLGSDEEILKFAKGFLKGTTAETYNEMPCHVAHPSWWGMLRTTRTSGGKNRYGVGRTLQNIPKQKSKDPYRIRRAFVARPGYSLLCVDYDQLELRIIAFLTQDPILLEIFATGQDPHSMMAITAFHLDCPVEEVKARYPEFRDKAKAVNYGIAYGLTEYGLSIQTKCSLEEARRIIQQWFEAAPFARDYITSCHEFARYHGFIPTIYGHRRYLPGLYKYLLNGRHAPPPSERGAWSHDYNVASNHPIQSMAGLVMRMAQVTLAHDPRSIEMGLRQCAQIHDELLCEVPIEHAEEAMIVVQENMQSAKEKVMQLARPHSYIYLPPDFTASPHVGFSWEDAKGG